jgi:competence protein ComEC
LLVSLIVMVVISFVRSRKLAVSAIAGVVSIWLAVSAVDALVQKNELRLTFLSLGQSESTLINLPDGRTMLVDGGGRPEGTGDDFGKRYLEPALHRLGVRRIDCLVLTHPHPDHLQGLVRIAEVFPVGEFWLADTREHNVFLEKLEAILAGKGVRIVRLTGQSPLRDFGGCRFEFLAPLMPLLDDENEDSLVFRVRGTGCSALFTGDIGFATEERLLKRPGLLVADVLKVPHHGSRYSSSPEFLRAVAPRHALISAGYGNRFGLPAAETLDRLEKAGARIHRTDQDGTITAIYRHDKWEFLEYNYKWPF